MSEQTAIAEAPGLRPGNNEETTAKRRSDCNGIVLTTLPPLRAKVINFWSQFLAFVRLSSGNICHNRQSLSRTFRRSLGVCVGLGCDPPSQRRTAARTHYLYESHCICRRPMFARPLPPRERGWKLCDIAAPNPAILCQFGFQLNRADR